MGPALAPLLIVFLESAAGVPLDSCKPSLILPAYAHNDYRNQRPLHDALEQGFRGVEADVFRVGSELLLGHDRSALRSTRTLSRLYLEPLRERQRSCGFILPDSSSFFLNVELKEPDSLAFRYLVGELGRFEELFRGRRPGGNPPVQVTLVGWWPSDSNGWPAYLRIQLSVDQRGTAPTNGGPIGMVSIDYGKVLKWSGRGTVPAAVQRTLGGTRDTAAALGVVLRVHHAPLDSTVYQWLLSHGVALIGTTDLKRSRAILEHLQGARLGSHSGQ